MASVEPADPKIQLITFTENAMDVNLHFQITLLDNQMYVWVGCNGAPFHHFATATKTPYDKLPSSTTLIGGSAGNQGNNISQRLALKTGWQVALSWNVPDASPMLQAVAERRLLAEITQYLAKRPEGPDGDGDGEEGPGGGVAAEGPAGGGAEAIAA